MQKNGYFTPPESTFAYKNHVNNSSGSNISPLIKSLFFQLEIWNKSLLFYHSRKRNKLKTGNLSRLKLRLTPLKIIKGTIINCILWNGNYITSKFTFQERVFFFLMEDMFLIWFLPDHTFLLPPGLIPIKASKFHPCGALKRIVSYCYWEDLWL